MEVRNPFAFALALLCLATSASLGVLVHDGAVGATSLATSEAGDEVRFKAEAQEAGAMEPVLRAWSFQGNTADLMLTGDGHHVIVLHQDDSIRNGTWIVDGLVRGHVAHGEHTMTIVDATAVTAPILFA